MPLLMTHDSDAITHAITQMYAITHAITHAIAHRRRKNKHISCIGSENLNAIAKRLGLLCAMIRAALTDKCRGRPLGD